MTGTADQPTTLEMEWYKPGPLQPDCVVLKDLYIKIESRVAQGSHFVDLHVSHHFIFLEAFLIENLSCLQVLTVYAKECTNHGSIMCGEADLRELSKYQLL